MTSSSRSAMFAGNPTKSEVVDGKTTPRQQTGIELDPNDPNPLGRSLVEPRVEVYTGVHAIREYTGHMKRLSIEQIDFMLYYDFAFDAVVTVTEVPKGDLRIIDIVSGKTTISIQP